MALGIFCIENWSADLRSPSSVRPLLEFLEAEREIKFIHQRVASVDELHAYMDAWHDYTSYELGFLALHGSSANVWVGAEPVTVEELMDRATPEEAGRDEPWSLDLTGKFLYFGSCATFASSKRIETFRRRTGAKAVFGYTRSVPWYEAAAFEVLLLSTLTSSKRPLAALRGLDRRYPELVQRLGFRVLPEAKAR